jgi:hypothetical protein
LSPDDAAVEHVEVTIAGGGVSASARSLGAPPTVDGVPFATTALLPEAVLGVGRARVRVAVTDSATNENVIRKQKKRMSPLTYALAAVVLPFSVYMMLARRAVNTDYTPPRDVPELWGEPVAGCKVLAREQALAFAREAQAMAETKRERRPFHVEDGVAAVPIFETAAACYRQGGDEGTASVETNAAQTLRTKVGADYRAHQVRLEHALDVRDLASARREVRVLRAITVGKSGKYIEWLSALERNLAMTSGARSDS